MINKHTFANAGVLDFDKEGIVNGGGKKIAGPSELSSIKLTGNGSSGYVEIYDANDSSGATYTNLKWVLDSSVSTDDSNFFPAPINFAKGIYVVLNQGATAGNVLSFATIGLGHG